MADHTRIFGSALPTGTDDMGDWPTDAGYFSVDFSERFTLDHQLDGILVGTNPAQDGRHRKVTMKEISSPTAIDNCGIVFTKEADSLTELHYLDDLASGNEIKITKDSDLNGPGWVLKYREIYDSIVKLSGVTSATPYYTIFSPSSFLRQTNIPYPDGFTKDNSSLLFGKLGSYAVYSSGSISGSYYTTLNLGVRGNPSIGFIDYSTFIRTEGKIIFEESQIKIITYDTTSPTINNSDTTNKQYIVVLGKLI